MKVLFLGEGSLEGSARYLAAILHWAGIPFDHRPDRAPLPASWLSRRYEAVLLSDYRAASWTQAARRWLIQSVENGMGLMMIGGWASFTGAVGGYAGTEIERLLPVRCIPGDDRVNHPAVLCGGNEPSVIVCGYHRCRPKPGSRTVLEFRDLAFREGQPRLGRHQPALVLGQSGKGRTAAFLTDCAPHWAGGLVDWGRKRVVVKENGTELGETYLKFFTRWIRWTAFKKA